MKGLAKFVEGQLQKRKFAFWRVEKRAYYCNTKNIRVRGIEPRAAAIVIFERRQC